MSLSKNSPDVVDFSNSLKTKTEKCKNLEDYVDLAFTFNYGNISIIPLQKKYEIYFLVKVLSETKPKRLLEIGTSNGGTLFLLSRIASSDAVILSIDLPDGPFGGKLFPDWKMSLYESFASAKQKIHLIRENSHDNSTLEKCKTSLENEPLDFLLIDGDHTYEGVKKDFEMYSNLVKDGGIIAFHDISEGPKENVGGVPKFWKEIKLNYPNIEIIDSASNEGYGIGLLINSSSKTSKKREEIFQMLNEFQINRIIKLQNQIKNVKYDSSNHPLEVLMNIYSERPDLQQTFPEVSTGDFSNIIKWVLDVCAGRIEQEETTKNIFSKFTRWYSNYALKTKSEKEKISDLSLELSQHKNTIDSLEYDKTNLEHDKTNLEHDKTNLEHDKTNLEYDKTNLEQETTNLQKEFTKQKTEKKLLMLHNYNLLNGSNRQKNELNAIKASKVFRLIRFYGNRLDILFSPNTSFGRFKLAIVLSLKIIKNEGIKSYFKKSKNKIKKREFTMRTQHTLLEHTQNKFDKPKFNTSYISPIKNRKTIQPKFSISIVIPTNSSVSSLKPLFEKINSQKGLKDVQIILVNSGPHDLSLLNNGNNLEIIKIPPKEFNHGKSRNLGISKATENFIILQTDDAIPITDYLYFDMCEWFLKDPKIAVVSARQIPKSNSDLISQFTINKHYFYLDLTKDTIRYSKNFNELNFEEKRKIAQIDDVCSCYRGEIFSKHKFKEIQYAEDLELGIRLIKDGYKICQLYESGVMHSHTRSSSYHFKRGFVDSIWLYDLLGSDHNNPKTREYQSLSEFSNDVFHVLKSLGNIIDISKEKKPTIATESFELLKNGFPTFYGNDISPESTDKDLFKILNDIFNFNSRKEMKESPLLPRYYSLIDRFEAYMKSSNPYVINIENEFYETLYKLLGSCIGVSLANFYIDAVKNKTEDEHTLQNIKKILTGGI